MKKVVTRYVRKTERLSLRNSFDYWKLLFQKRFRELLKDIVPALNHFGASIVE